MSIEHRMKHAKRIALVLMTTIGAAFIERAAGSALQPVPDAPSRGAAEKTIKDLYRAEFAKSGAANKIALAKKLREQADKSRDLPAERFVLLSEASDLFADGGDISPAVEAVQATAIEFQIDVVDAKLSLITRGARNAKDSGKIAMIALDVLKEAATAERFADAVKASAVAKNVLPKLKDKQLAARVKVQTADLESWQQEYKGAKAAELSLQKNTGDPAANFAAGAYRCFRRREWQTGLPLLAKGSDGTLAALAKRDLSRPAESSAMNALANDWWAAGERSPKDAASIRHRAAEWYIRAIPTLPAMQKAIARKRVNDATMSEGRHVDLLALIDPQHDAVNGTWKKLEDGTLMSGPQQFAKCRMPYLPPDEYDFTVVLARKTGNEAFVQFCLLGDQQLQWCLASHQNTDIGFLIPGDQTGLNPQNPTFVPRGNVLTNGRKFTSAVKVRKDLVQVFLDDEEVAHFDRNTTHLPPYDLWLLPEPATLGVGSYESEYAFYSIDLLEITGSGKPSR